MAGKKFMDIGYCQAGRKMVLDRAEHALIVEPAARMDSTITAERDCGACGLCSPAKDLLAIRMPSGGIRFSICPKCGRPYYPYDKPGHLVQACPICGYPTEKLMQQATDELERAKTLIPKASNSALKRPSLTVGDISVVTAKNRADAARALEKKVKGLTIGDISVATARKRGET